MFDVLVKKSSRKKDAWSLLNKKVFCQQHKVLLKILNNKHIFYYFYNINRYIFFMFDHDKIHVHDTQISEYEL